MPLDIEPGTWTYAVLLFVGVVLAVTVANVVVLDTSVGGALLRGAAIGFGAAAMNWYAN
ncbi:hypothetical protein ACH9L7_17050 (plasmid) [Haloferax sp. S1W]|uniref:hypothetical protein n=1 Tax=Haloferax sp. S1W TaxID=3377110 RepID=UPI0037CC3625